MQGPFTLLVNTLIYNLINAVAISIALIVLLRAVTHFVPIVDWDHFKRSTIGSTIILSLIVLTFIIFSAVGIG